MSWSWINCPPLWAPLTFWMQGINYLWFNGTEEAVGFIWTSARWYVGCPFSFNIVRYVTRSASWRIMNSVSVTRAKWRRQRARRFFWLLRWSWRTGRSGWVALPSGSTGQRGQPAKKEKWNTRKTLIPCPIRPPGGTKKHPPSLPPTHTHTHHILQRHIPRLKKRL